MKIPAIHMAFASGGVEKEMLGFGTIFPFSSSLIKY